MRSHYTIKPRADCDIEDYAGYLARNASLDVALRFLTAADETFSLLATQPNIGWHARLRTRRLARYACSASQGLNGCSFSTGRWKTGGYTTPRPRLPQAAGALAPAGNRVIRRLLEEPAAAFYSCIANNLAQSRKLLFDGSLVITADRPSPLCPNLQLPGSGDRELPGPYRDVSR